MSTGTVSFQQKYVVTQMRYTYQYKNGAAQINTNALKVRLSAIDSLSDINQALFFKLPVTSEIARHLTIGTQVSLTMSVIS